MQYHELEKLTVAKLRELAHEFPDITGASGLHKEQLIDLLCQKMGIEKPHRVAVGVDKAAIKTQIRALKKERDEVIARKDRVKLAEIRRRMHLLRRDLHKAAKIIS